MIQRISLDIWIQRKKMVNYVPIILGGEDIDIWTMQELKDAIYTY